MAHGYCRPDATACACNGGGGQSRCILRGADVIASLWRFACTSTDADRFTVYACRPRDNAAERSAAAATPFAFGLPGAHARLRARMAESEGNRSGSRQDLVRIRPGLSRKVNLRRFGPSEQPRAPIGYLQGCRLLGTLQAARKLDLRRVRRLSCCENSAPARCQGPSSR